MNIRIWAGLGLGVTALAACGGAGTNRGDTASSTGSGAGGESASASTTTSSTTGAGAAGGGTTTMPDGGTKPDAGTTEDAGASGLTVYVTPDSAIPNQIVAAIEAATTSVHMTMYILDNTAIVAALVDRAHAGLDVRVIMNQTFPAGTNESNPTTYTTLHAAGAGVVWRNGPPGAAAGAYTHEKAFVVDGKQAWITTMNFDASAARYNREYLVVDDDAADVAETDEIFLADYAGTANSSGDPLVVSPTNSRAALVALIASATAKLDVEVEEFSDNDHDGVVDAVVAALGRGVATRVILANSTPSSAQLTAIAAVKAAGAKVVVSGGTSGASTMQKPYIHAKTILVDCVGTVCPRGFIGSENFTASSLGYNRELGLILDDETQLAKVESAIDADFSLGTAQ